MFVTINDLSRLLPKASKWFCSKQTLQLYTALGALILQDITANTLYLISIFYFTPKVGLSDLPKLLLTNTSVQQMFNFFN